MGNLVGAGSIWGAIFYWNTYRKSSLPPLNADPDSVTFSGFSGGAFYSALVAVSNSDKVKGAGFFSGGAYGATIDVLTTAIENKPKECGYDEYFKKSEEIADAGPNI